MSRRLGAVRPSSAEIDAGILDIAAALIARRGVADTSVQAVADGAGYSKAGVLKRFASKAELVDAAVRQCLVQTEEALVAVGSLPDGPARDAAALAALVDLALGHPGWGEMALASVSRVRDDELMARLVGAGPLLERLFDSDAGTRASLDRRARVVAAIGVVAVLALVHESDVSTVRARPVILDASWSTLGHSGRFPDYGIDA